MQFILSQTTSCASSALPPAWAPFHSLLLPLIPTYPIVTCSPLSSTCVHAHMFGGCRGSKQVEGESRRIASGPCTLSGTAFSHDRSPIYIYQFGSRERENDFWAIRLSSVLANTGQGPPETEPDRLFLLHFLSQDSFPWGIYPSFSSPHLLLTPPLRRAI